MNDHALCYPVFLKLSGRPVLVVGGGPMATSKLEGLLQSGARITVVSPEVTPEIAALAADPASPLTLHRRPFAIADLDEPCYVVAAATPDVNRLVAHEAEARRLFVNAVDDPANASVYLGGVVRRAGVTLAISTDGQAPALAGLLREGLDALLPADLDRWTAAAHRARVLWKAEGVPMEQRRPRLLQALVELYAQRAREATREELTSVVTNGGDTAVIATGDTADQTAPDVLAAHASSAASIHPAASGASGFVSLVGAGPGDPELLTRRALTRLAEADLVLYDALASPELLPLAPRAQKLSVGKRACKPSISQDTINRVLIRAARRGKRVVRLKCGDPLVFGRGGEEGLALAAAGVRFEIVPGVSSALAAPALAGIPVTHRGIASSFVVVSGHSESTYAPVLDSLSPGAATVVVLMGVAQRASLAARLIAHGWQGRTPAAVLLSASTPDAITWTGTLDALAHGIDGLHVEPGEAPGTLVIGEVVSLAAVLGLSRHHATLVTSGDADDTIEVAHGSGR